MHEPSTQAKPPYHEPPCLKPRRLVMVKKRFANGDTCGKCAQAESMLRDRGLWAQVDEVVLADELDPESPGMQLARKHKLQTAPFFILSEGGGDRVYSSTLRLIQDLSQQVQPNVSDEASALSSEQLAEAALSLAGQAPEEILRWGLSRFGARAGIAFSGAEDVALIDMAKRSGLPFSVFCLDTGRLHPETYRFIDRVRARYEIAIDIISPEREPLEALVRKKGLFSFYEEGHQECCGIRKVAPLKSVLLGLDAWVSGQRRDQSPATRTALEVVESDSNQGRSERLVKLNPLANWSSQQVWEYIRQYGVPYNELHDRGYVSIGCEPCTRALRPGEHERAARWWWEEATQRECGLHLDTKP